MTMIQVGETEASPDYSSSSSLREESRSSEGTSCSNDLVEDASSSSSVTCSQASFSSSSSSSSSFVSKSNDGRGREGPLYELSELMTHLPIKRGLSRYYQGKSQSFTSLTSVRSLEDLMKKQNPCTKRLKVCRSFEGGLDGRGRTSFPCGSDTKAKAMSVMTKQKGSRPRRGGSSFLSSPSSSSSSPAKMCTAINSRPPIPIVKTF